MDCLLFKKCSPTHSLSLPLTLILGLLLSGCGGGSSDSKSPSQIQISGMVTFDRVPSSKTSGLDYDALTTQPSRGITINIVRDSDKSTLGTAVTGSDGRYSLSINTPDTAIFVRAKAQMKQSSSNSWDFTVKDNTRSNALFSLDGLPFTTSQNMTKNLHAASGWNGSSYQTTRAAAPFAILDSVYATITQFNAIQSAISYPALTLYWSSNNTPSDGDNSLGQIGTSYYSNGSIYILGKADIDTDEYDQHVIVHEFGHYLEDKLSRSDTIGGSHGLGDFVDMRVAFSEGWGNALSAMITNDPVYVDTFSSGQNLSSGFDIENNSAPNDGWYSEASVMSLLYDVFDQDNEGVDTITLGLEPFYTILTQHFKNSDAFISIFSFITALKEINPEISSQLDQMLTLEQITATNDADRGSDVLPIYTELTPNGAGKEICVSNFFASSGDENKLAQHRFAYFQATTDSSYQITVTGLSGSDPDFMLLSQGQTQQFKSVGPTETSPFISLSSGTHLIDMYDYALLHPSGSFQSNARSCLFINVFQ